MVSNEEEHVWLRDVDDKADPEYAAKMKEDENINGED